MSGDARSKLARKNIILSFGSRFIGILTSFLLVPITIGYLDKTKYGIWITLSSVVVWLDFMDIGLGGGLQNKLAEALARDDKPLAKKLVSTAYAFILMLSVIIIVLFIIINNYLSWPNILNADNSYYAELYWLAIIVFLCFAIQLVLRLIYTVLMAIQRSGIANMAGVISSVISLAIIYVITKTTHSSLIYAGLGLSLSPIFIQIAVSLYLFKYSIPHLMPSIRSIDFSLLKEILNLGIKFFFIRISGIVLFQTSNFLISNLFSPADVTPYNIATKLFSSIYMVFTIVIAPFQAAFTEAYVKQDFAWIKKIINQLLMIWVAALVFGIALLFLSPFIYRVWVGKEIEIDFTLSALCAFHYLVFTLGGIFNMFINGTGKLVIQLICLGIGSVVFLPLAYVLVHYLNFGINGIVFAMILVNFYSPIIAPIQYYKLISNKASGLWAR